MAVARGPRESALLNFMNDAFISSKAYQARAAHLSAAQEYGVGNPIFDHGSRGRVQETERLMIKMGLKPRWMAVPQAYVDFLNLAVDFWLEGDARRAPAMHSTAVEQGTAANGAGPRTPFADLPVCASPCCGARGGCIASCPLCEGSLCTACKAPCGASAGMVLCLGCQLPRLSDLLAGLVEPPSPLAGGAGGYEADESAWEGESDIFGPRRSSAAASHVEADPEDPGACTGTGSDSEEVVSVDSEAGATDGQGGAGGGAGGSSRCVVCLEDTEQRAVCCYAPLCGGCLTQGGRVCMADRGSSDSDLDTARLQASRKSLGGCPHCRHPWRTQSVRRRLVNASQMAGPSAHVPLHATAVQHGPAANGAGPRTPFSQVRRAAHTRSRPPSTPTPGLMLLAAAVAARPSSPAPERMAGPLRAGLDVQPAAKTVAGRSGLMAGAPRPPRAERAACPMRRADPGERQPPPAVVEAAVERRAAAGWEAALAADESSMALCPGNPSKLTRLLDMVGDKMAHAFAQGTNDKDAYHLKAWKGVCAELGTPCWRTDAAANSGADPVGHKREVLLLAVALVMLYARMRPRSKKDPAPNPRSALQKLRAVAREHKKRGLTMAPLTFATEVMKGMLHNAVQEHGTDWLAPARKKPLTNAIVTAMLTPRDGLAGAGFVIALASYFWLSAVATFAVLAETGMRKADVSKPLASSPFLRGRLTFASLRWEIDGVQYAALTRAQLLAARVGYACYLVYGALKNDPYAEVYGSRPSKLLYEEGARPNACRALVALEIAAAVPEARREVTPLFGPAVGKEWHHSLLTKVFRFLLVAAAGVPEAEADAYSIHSFRIYLACALYAAGCPNDRIQAILRWKSDEALLIYARLNDSERCAWIERARAATVDSNVAAHLPTVDGADMAARLMELRVDAVEEEADSDEEAP